jgi:hypothetical protein
MFKKCKTKYFKKMKKLWILDNKFKYKFFSIDYIRVCKRKKIKVVVVEFVLKKYYSK